MCRKDIPKPWDVEAMAGSGPDHPLDVVLVPKHRLYSREVARRPLVVIPYACVKSCQTPMPTSLRAPHCPTAEQAKHWLELARELLHVYPSDERVIRTAQYLVHLARGQRARGPYPDLPWLQSARPDQELANIVERIYEPIALRRVVGPANFAASRKRDPLPH